MMDKCTYLEKKGETVQKFCFPDWRFGESSVKSERSGSDIPVLRPNHNHVSSSRLKEGYSFFSKTHGSTIRNGAWAPNRVVGLT